MESRAGVPDGPPVRKRPGRKPNPHVEEQKLKRKEQNREAQRHHRERKERYVVELERRIQELCGQLSAAGIEPLPERAELTTSRPPPKKPKKGSKDEESDGGGSADELFSLLGAKLEPQAAGYAAPARQGSWTNGAGPLAVPATFPASYPASYPATYAGLDSLAALTTGLPVVSSPGVMADTGVNGLFGGPASMLPLAPYAATVSPARMASTASLGQAGLPANLFTPNFADLQAATAYAEPFSPVRVVSAQPQPQPPSPYSHVSSSPDLNATWQPPLPLFMHFSEHILQNQGVPNVPMLSDDMEFMEQMQKELLAHPELLAALSSGDSCALPTEPLPGAASPGKGAPNFSQCLNSLPSQEVKEHLLALKQLGLVDVDDLCEDLRTKARCKGNPLDWRNWRVPRGFYDKWQVLKGVEGIPEDDV